MSTFLRGHSSFLLSLGAGIAIGACATIALRRLTSSLDRKLAKLVTSIEQLQREVHELNVKLQQAEKKVSKTKAGYYSVHQSSGEEEEEENDEFQDTIEESDFEKLRLLSAAGSGELQSRDADSQAVSGEGSEELFAQVDKLMAGSDTEQEEALTLLQQRHSRLSNDPNYLWRFSKANYQNAVIQEGRGDQETRRQLFFKAVDIIREALVTGEHIPQVHKWYAITLGKQGDFLGTQEKIKNGFTFKDHIEKAIDLDPKDSSNHYLLGRWCYGVYMLTWFERQAAATFFASPPTATVDDALQHFLKAEELSKAPWKENKLFIAKCFLEKRDYSSAASWLKKADSVPAQNQDDKTAQSEVDGLIAKYGRYAQ